MSPVADTVLIWDEKRYTIYQFHTDVPVYYIVITLHVYFSAPNSFLKKSIAFSGVSFQPVTRFEMIPRLFEFRIPCHLSWLTRSHKQPILSFSTWASRIAASVITGR